MRITNVGFLTIRDPGGQLATEPRYIRRFAKYASGAAVPGRLYPIHIVFPFCLARTKRDLWALHGLSYPVRYYDGMPNILHLFGQAIATEPWLPSFLNWVNQFVIGVITGGYAPRPVSPARDRTTAAVLYRTITLRPGLEMSLHTLALAANPQPLIDYVTHSLSLPDNLVVSPDQRRLFITAMLTSPQAAYEAIQAACSGGDAYEVLEGALQRQESESVEWESDASESEEGDEEFLPEEDDLWDDFDAQGVGGDEDETPFLAEQEEDSGREIVPSEPGMGGVDTLPLLSLKEAMRYLFLAPFSFYSTQQEQGEKQEEGPLEEMPRRHRRRDRSVRDWHAMMDGMDGEALFTEQPRQKPNSPRIQVCHPHPLSLVLSLILMPVSACAFGWEELAFAFLLIAIPRWGIGLAYIAVLTAASLIPLHLYRGSITPKADIAIVVSLYALLLFSMFYVIRRLYQENKIEFDPWKLFSSTIRLVSSLVRSLPSPKKATQQPAQGVGLIIPQPSSPPSVRPRLDEVADGLVVIGLALLLFAPTATAGAFLLLVGLSLETQRFPYSLLFAATGLGLRYFGETAEQIGLGYLLLSVGATGASFDSFVSDARLAAGVLLRVRQVYRLLSRNPRLFQKALSFARVVRREQPSPPPKPSFVPPPELAFIYDLIQKATGSPPDALAAWDVAMHPGQHHGFWRIQIVPPPGEAYSGAANIREHIRSLFPSMEVVSDSRGVEFVVAHTCLPELGHVTEMEREDSIPSFPPAPVRAAKDRIILPIAVSSHLNSDMRDRPRHQHALTALVLDPALNSHMMVASQSGGGKSVLLSTIMMQAARSGGVRILFGDGKGEVAEKLKQQLTGKGAFYTPPISLTNGLAVLHFASGVVGLLKARSDIQTWLLQSLPDLQKQLAQSSPGERDDKLRMWLPHLAEEERASIARNPELLGKTLQSVQTFTTLANFFGPDLPFSLIVIDEIWNIIAGGTAAIEITYEHEGKTVRTRASASDAFKTAVTRAIIVGRSLGITMVMASQTWRAETMPPAIRDNASAVCSLPNAQLMASALGSEAKGFLESIVRGGVIGSSTRYGVNNLPKYTMAVRNVGGACAVIPAGISPENCQIIATPTADVIKAFCVEREFLEVMGGIQVNDAPFPHPLLTAMGVPAEPEDMEQYTGHWKMSQREVLQMLGMATISEDEWLALCRKNLKEVVVPEGVRLD